MAFTDEQRRALQAKLSFRHVKTRAGHGTNGSLIPYVEGWHVIAEANRIFGYDSWDRKTIAPRCVWSELRRGETACFYTTKVRVTVRAGGERIEREGIGTGIGRAMAPELAHEIALKAAETDATKRALATFGNPFGLALYDKEKTKVTRPTRRASHTEGSRRSKPATAAGIEKAVGNGIDGTGNDPEAPQASVDGRLILTHSGEGRKEAFGTSDTFVAAALKMIPTLATIDDLYGFWEANIESLRILRSLGTDTDQGPVATIISMLKTRARLLGSTGNDRITGRLEHGQLALPKEKRIRNKDHLAFVAGQPCLVCGRRPAQAHHLRFAQQRAMAMKVSDEYTVPLCSGHHDALHRTGDERAWWARHGIIEPLKVAGRLWAASRLKPPIDDEDVGDQSLLPQQVQTPRAGQTIQEAQTTMFELGSSKSPGPESPVAAPTEAPRDRRSRLQ